MLGRFCALGAGIPVESRLHLGKKELSGNTGELPVDQVLISLVLRRRFLFIGQELQMFLLVFIGASRQNQQCRDCINLTRSNLRPYVAQGV
jgi:hypothetical protein